MFRDVMQHHNIENRTTPHQRFNNSNNNSNPAPIAGPPNSSTARKAVLAAPIIAGATSNTSHNTTIPANASTTTHLGGSQQPARATYHNNHHMSGGGGGSETFNALMNDYQRIVQKSERTDDADAARPSAALHSEVIRESQTNANKTRNDDDSLAGAAAQQEEKAHNQHPQQQHMTHNNNNNSAWSPMPLRPPHPPTQAVVGPSSHHQRVPIPNPTTAAAGADVDGDVDVHTSNKTIPTTTATRKGHTAIMSSTATTYDNPLRVAVPTGAPYSLTPHQNTHNNSNNNNSSSNIDNNNNNNSRLDHSTHSPDHQQQQRIVTKYTPVPPSAASASGYSGSTTINSSSSAAQATAAQQQTVHHVKQNSHHGSHNAPTVDDDDIDPFRAPATFVAASSTSAATTTIPPTTHTTTAASAKTTHAFPFSSASSASSTSTLPPPNESNVVSSNAAAAAAAASSNVVSSSALYAAPAAIKKNSSSGAEQGGNNTNVSALQHRKPLMPLVNANASALEVPALTSPVDQGHPPQPSKESSNTNTDSNKKPDITLWSRLYPEGRVADTTSGGGGSHGVGLADHRRRPSLASASAPAQYTSGSSIAHAQQSQHYPTRNNTNNPEPKGRDGDESLSVMDSRLYPPQVAVRLSQMDNRSAPSASVYTAGNKGRHSNSRSNSQNSDLLIHASSNNNYHQPAAAPGPADSVLVSRLYPPPTSSAQQPPQSHQSQEYGQHYYLDGHHPSDGGLQHHRLESDEDDDSSSYDDGYGDETDDEPNGALNDTLGVFDGDGPSGGETEIPQNTNDAYSSRAQFFKHYCRAGQRTLQRQEEGGRVVVMKRFLATRYDLMTAFQQGVLKISEHDVIHDKNQRIYNMYERHNHDMAAAAASAASAASAAASAKLADLGFNFTPSPKKGKREKSEKKEKKSKRKKDKSSAGSLSPSSPSPSSPSPSYVTTTGSVSPNDVNSMVTRTPSDRNTNINSIITDLWSPSADKNKAAGAATSAAADFVKGAPSTLYVESRYDADLLYANQSGESRRNTADTNSNNVQVKGGSSSSSSPTAAAAAAVMYMSKMLPIYAQHGGGGSKVDGGTTVGSYLLYLCAKLKAAHGVDIIAGLGRQYQYPTTQGGSSPIPSPLLIQPLADDANNPTPQESLKLLRRAMAVGSGKKPMPLVYNDGDADKSRISFVKLSLVFLQEEPVTSKVPVSAGATGLDSPASATNSSPSPYRIVKNIVVDDINADLYQLILRTLTEVSSLTHPPSPFSTKPDSDGLRYFVQLETEDKGVSNQELALSVLSQQKQRSDEQSPENVRPFLGFSVQELPPLRPPVATTQQTTALPRMNSDLLHFNLGPAGWDEEAEAERENKTIFRHEVDDMWVQGPGHKAGVLPGDRITHVNGVDVTRSIDQCRVALLSAAMLAFRSTMNQMITSAPKYSGSSLSVPVILTCMRPSAGSFEVAVNPMTSDASHRCYGPEVYYDQAQHHKIGRDHTSSSSSTAFRA